MDKDSNELLPEEKSTEVVDSSEIKRVPVKKRILFIALVVILVLSVGALFAFQKSDVLNTEQKKEDMSSEDAGAVINNEEKETLLLCQTEKKMTYDPANGSVTDSDLCVNDTDTLSAIYSNSGSRILLEAQDGNDYRKLYLIDNSDTETRELIFSANSSEETILEKVWQADDSGFLFAVRYGEGSSGFIDDPNNLDYYEVKITDRGPTEPKKIYSSTGYHSGSEKIIGYDINRDLLIMQRVGSGGCFEISIINIASSAKTDLSNNSCSIVIDYEKSLLYKVDYDDNGQFISQNYINGTTTTLAVNDNGHFVDSVSSNNNQTFYLVRNISGKNLGDFINPTDEKNEIVRYKIQDNRSETIRSFNKLSTINIESISPSGSYLVFNGQDFSMDGSDWPSYKNIIDTTSGEEKVIPVEEYYMSNYSIWVNGR